MKLIEYVELMLLRKRQGILEKKYKALPCAEASFPETDFPLGAVEDLSAVIDMLKLIRSVYEG
jgi:hypothetical protein